MSKYESVAAQVIRNNPAPYPGILLDVVEDQRYPGWFFLTLYASNIAEYSDDQIHSITDWINLLLKTLNAHPLVGAKFAFNISHEEPK